jgi:arsenate reductase
MDLLHGQTKKAHCILMTVVLAALQLAASVEAQQKQGATPEPKSTRVLFMCPHGAAKSVLASAYFRRLAKERGLNVIVDSAGTEPDPSVAPAVAAHLTKQQYPVRTEKPRLATPADLANADVVISLGCDLSCFPAPSGTLIKWDDVPPLSENFAAADDSIRRHVTALVEELVQQVNAGAHVTRL